MMTQIDQLPSMAPFDPVDPKVMECPYPYFRCLQEDAPVHRVPNAPYYLVSRFAEVRDVLRRHEDFSSDLTSLFGGMGAGSPFVPAPVLNLSDPPIHSRTKPVAMRAFGPKHVKRLEPKIREIVDDLIDQFIDSGEVELIEAFALPLPMRIIAGELGIPVEDIPRFKHWSDQMLVFNNAASTREQIRAAEKVIEVANIYLREKFLAKRIAPTGDVMSILATAETDETDTNDGQKPRPLTDDEALAIIQLILVGGNETTTNAIANSMLLLLQRPQLIVALQAGEADWGAAIEECLRLESPVRGFWRLAARDTEISGVTVPKGTMVFLSFAAGNRDADQFESPDILNPMRANMNTHLAFGHGIHICIGFRLARMEIEIALRQLFTRLKDIRLTPGKSDADNLYVPTALVRGLQSLNLSFVRA